MQTSRALLSLMVILVAIPALPSLGQAAAVPTGSHLPAAAPQSPANANQAGVYWFNTSDMGGSKVSGVTMEVTSFAMPLPTGSGTGSFELAAGVAVGGNLILAGVEANLTYTGQAVHAFAAELNETTLYPQQFVLGPSPPVGSLVTLSVELSGAQTWVAYVNGTPLLNVTGASGPITSPNSLIQVALTSWNETPWVPREVYLPQAIEFLTQTGWHLPNEEYVWWPAGKVPPPPLNISSQSTDPAMVPGELDLGSAVSSPDNGLNVTRLWSGTPTLPLTLAGTGFPSLVQAGATVNVSWRATQQGKPMGGFRVDMWGSAGGNMTTLVTNAGGWANTTYRTPLVKTQTEVYLNASLLNAIYYGSGSVTVTVTTLIHLTVTILASARATTVSLIAWVRANNASVAGAQLFPSASAGGGAFTPWGPWSTDAAGYAYANYTPPAITGNITLWVNASYAGYSASSSVQVVVSHPGSSPSPASDSPPLWVYGAIGGVLAVGIVLGSVLYAKRSRARRQAAEDEAPPAKPEAPPGSSEGPGPEPEPTQSP